MPTLALYLAAVLIWGSTWFAITFQLGVVAPVVSIVYRFALAAVLLFAYAAISGRRLGLPLREYPMVVVQGVLLFGLNYLLVYHATAFVTSGLIAVLFTLLIFVNAINERLFFGTRIEPVMVVAALAGIVGLVLIFWPELAVLNGQAGAAAGVLLALASVVCASFGNMVALRNTRRKVPIVALNAHGMAAGAALSAVYALFSGHEFTFDSGWPYVASLIYLSLFGSALAFGCYLVLIERIGSSRAAYITVLFPIVALTLSTLFEGYHWTWQAVAGVTVALGGTAVALAGRTHFRPVTR